MLNNDWAMCWLQTSEESEASAGRLRDAEASSATLQIQLNELRDSQEARATQSSEAQAAPISQEDADGMLLPCCMMPAQSAMSVTELIPIVRMCLFLELVLCPIPCWV